MAVGEDATDAAAGGGVVAVTAGDKVDVAVEDGLAGVRAVVDAEVEAGNNAAALKHYNKAIEMDDNAITSPFALFKAGMVYLMDNQPQKAIECFQKVKDDYSESLFKSQMDGFIEYAKNL